MSKDVLRGITKPRRVLSGLLATGLAAEMLTGCGPSATQAPSDSKLRSIAAAEAQYYSEATRIAGQEQAALQQNRATSLTYLHGRLSLLKHANGTAREYGPITDPILLVSGPDSAPTPHDDNDLDGGFIGVQSTGAQGQIEINVIPFDKETMHFESAAPKGVSPYSSTEVALRQLHGSLMGPFAVGRMVGSERMGYQPGQAIIPGYAPHQSR